MKQYNKWILFSAISIVILLFSIGIFSFSESTIVEHIENKLTTDICVYQKINSVCPDHVHEFAGERVPLNDLEVMQRLDREVLVNTYWQSNTLLSLKLADKYFPIIEPILRANGVPDDFKYVALIESGLRDVVSPAGATGKWQLMKETAKNYGLTVNEEVDERYYLEKSTEVACKYFLQAYDTFHSWTDAVASYNIGIAGLKNRMKEQKVDNLYDLWLNSETSRYVFRIVALKELHRNPKSYGYHYGKEKAYSPDIYAYVIVDSTIKDLPVFAQEWGMKYKDLRSLNPWLRGYKLTNKDCKPYSIKIRRN